MVNTKSSATNSATDVKLASPNKITSVETANHVPTSNSMTSKATNVTISQAEVHMQPSTSVTVNDLPIPAVTAPSQTEQTKSLPHVNSNNSSSMSGGHAVHRENHNGKHVEITIPSDVPTKAIKTVNTNNRNSSRIKFDVTSSGHVNINMNTKHRSQTEGGQFSVETQETDL